VYEDEFQIVAEPFADSPTRPAALNRLIHWLQVRVLDGAPNDSGYRALPVLHAVLSISKLARCSFLLEW